MSSLRTIFRPERLSGWVVCLLMALGGAGSASAQLFPFLLRAQQGEIVANIANNSTVAVAAQRIGQSTTMRITATYRGAASATIPQAPEIFGSGTFSLTSSPIAPAVLGPAQSLVLEATFTPISSTPATAQIVVVFLEPPPAPNTPPITGLIVINLVGTTPNLVVSYFFQAEANVIPLPPGSRLIFPPTPIDTTAQAIVSVTNRGSGSGEVNGISVTGEAFQVLGIPLLPLQLNAGDELRFIIRYAPKQIETSTGSLQLVLGDNPVDIVLEASSTGPRFVYEVQRNGEAVPVSPDETITLPDTVLGESTSVSVLVRNTGNGDGTIGAIILSGPGFQVTNLPLLPRTLTPETALTFTITFTPTQAGVARGRLLIGNATFDIAATGVGTRLVYSYTSGSTPLAVDPGGSVFLSPVPIGQTARVSFSVRNTGTSAAIIHVIGIPEVRSAFSVAELPDLPATLQPNASLEFTIVFAPQTVGFVNATLRVDGASFQLSATATAPPPLPVYQFTGPPGTVEPLQQPAFGLTIATPYPAALNGTLTLTVDSEAPADPAVQFVTGGRTVSFTIPANTTQAVFLGNAREIRLQTGTVAGTISLTPSFALPGGFDITPENLLSHRITVAAGPPKLISVSAVNRTASGFVLAIAGFTTTRSLTALEITITPAPGFNIPTTRFTLNIEDPARLWFGSSQSQAFGGQFLISIPFSLRSERQNVPLIDAIRSISATVTSERGASAPLGSDL